MNNKNKFILNFLFIFIIFIKSIKTKDETNELNIKIPRLKINSYSKSKNKKNRKNKKISKIAKRLKRLKAKRALKNIPLLKNKNNTEIIVANEGKKETSNLSETEKKIIIKSFEPIIDLLNKNGKNISNLNFLINPFLQNLIKNNPEYKELNEFLDFIKNESISKIFEKIINNAKVYSTYIKQSLNENTFLENDKNYKFKKLTLEFDYNKINSPEIENKIINNFKYINIKNVPSEDDNLKFNIKNENENETESLNKNQLINELINDSFLPLFIRNVIVSKILNNNPNIEKIIEQFINLMGEKNQDKKESKKNILEAIKNGAILFDSITEEITNTLTPKNKENIIKIFSENNQDNYFKLIDESTYFEKLQIGFLLNNLSINNIIKCFTEKGENKNNLLKSALLWTGIAIGKVLFGKYSSFAVLIKATSFVGNFAKNTYDRAKNWINEGKPIFESNVGTLSKTWEYTKYFGNKTFDYLQFSPLSFLNKKNDAKTAVPSVKTSPKEETFKDKTKNFGMNLANLTLSAGINYGVNYLDEKINQNKTTSILFSAPSWALKSLINFSPIGILLNLANKGYNLFSGKNKNNKNGLISLNFKNNINDNSDISYCQIINATEYIIFLNSNNLITKFENINNENEE